MCLKLIAHHCGLIETKYRQASLFTPSALKVTHEIVLLHYEGRGSSCYVKKKWGSGVPEDRAVQSGRAASAKCFVFKGYISFMYQIWS